MTLISLHYTLLALCVSLPLFLILILNIRFLFSPIMISFCRKSVDSLLSLTTTTTAETTRQQRIVNPNYNSPTSSRGLVDLVTPASAGESSGDPIWSDATVDGLDSCTESLGSESSEERRSDGTTGDCEISSPPASSIAGERRRAARRRSATTEKNPPRRFPPPLPSLDRNGHPSFFLRPVRKDGRLELTEVKINRPEILRASREDGRLRLHFVVTGEEDGKNDNKNVTKNDMECIQEDRELVHQEVDQERLGFRRCHEEAVKQNPIHHHRNRNHRSQSQQLWRQQQRCVTTT